MCERDDERSNTGFRGPHSRDFRRFECAAAATSKRLGSLFGALVVVLAALSGIGPVVDEASATNHTIDSCTTITSSGSYELTDTVTAANTSACIEVAASDVTLDGNGNAVDGYTNNTIGSDGFADAIRGSTGVRVAGTDAARVTNVTIRNVNFEGGRIAINATHASNVEISDVTVTNASLQAIDVHETDGNVTIRNVETANSPRYQDPDTDSSSRSAVNVGPGSTSHDVAPDRIDITYLDVDDSPQTSNGTDAAVDLETDSGPITVTDSRITATPRGGLEVDANGGNGDVTVKDVHISDYGRETVGEAGLAVLATGDITISRTTLIRGGTTSNTSEHAVLARSDGGDVVFEDSTVRDVTGEVAVDVRASTTDGRDGVVRNVTVTDVAGPGISLDETGDDSTDNPLTLTDSTVENVSGYGVALDGTQLSVTDTSIVDVGGAGLTHDSDVSAPLDVSVRNVSVTDSGDDGIRIVEGSTSSLDDLRLTDVAVTNASGGAFRVTRVSAALDGLDVSSATLDGTARSVVVDSSPRRARPTLPSNREDVDAYFTAEATTSDGYLDATVRYDQSAVSAGLDESTLELWRYDGSWASDGGTVDIAANTVSANVTNFSVFAPLGSTGAPSTAAFDLAIDSSNSPVTETETLTVDATVENTGQQTGTETITLRVDGTARDSEAVTLAPGNATGVSLSWNTTAGDAGDYTATLSSPNTTAESVNVTVNDRPSGGPDTGTLDVTVLEAASGAAVSNATVTVSRNGSTVANLTTDAAGTATTGLAVGDYTVSAAASDYGTTNSTVSIAENNTTNATFRLNETATQPDSGGSDTGDSGGNETGDSGGSNTGGSGGDDTGDSGGSDTGDSGGSDTGDSGGSDTGDSGGSNAGSSGGSNTGGSSGGNTGGSGRGGGGDSATGGDDGDDGGDGDDGDRASASDNGTAVRIENSTATFDSETGVSSVTFDEDTNGDVVVETYAEPPAPAVDAITEALSDGDSAAGRTTTVTVVLVVDISPTDPVAEQSSARVTFVVDAAALSTPDDAVIVHETDTGWEEVPTSVEGTDNGTVRLVGDVESFSLFAVAEVESQATATPATPTSTLTVTPTSTPTVTPTDTPAEPATDATTTPATSTGSSGFGQALLLAVLAAAVGTVTLRYRSSKE